MLVPTGEEEAGTGQLVDWVQIEPWLAAAAAAHSFVHPSFLVVLFYFLRLGPIHHAAAADIGIGGVGYLQV